MDAVEFNGLYNLNPHRLYLFFFQKPALLNLIRVSLQEHSDFSDLVCLLIFSFAHRKLETLITKESKTTKEKKKEVTSMKSLAMEIIQW